jgi:hypothetical protein
MEGQSKSPERRTLLQRGLVALAAGFGIGASGRNAVAAPAAAPGGPVVVLRGRRRPSSPQGRLPRGAAAPRLVREGDLVDDRGLAVGRFSSSSFCAETPFGPQIAAASSLELQAFHLEDGSSLFGIGSAGAPSAAGRSLAILGGTGRFAGARGTYSEREVADGPDGRGSLEFVVTLVG